MPPVSSFWKLTSTSS
ncbi:hypothetical protein D046_5866A, partial [Vibrio parahaemolyticus V-223/04]